MKIKKIKKLEGILYPLVSPLTSVMETKVRRMRYVCKYFETKIDAGHEVLNCGGCTTTKQCPLSKAGEFTEECISTRPFVYGQVFSTTIEEHERKFHNIKKDC